MKRVLALGLLVLAAACASSNEGPLNADAGPDSITTSRSYKGHENEKDTNNFVAVYPKTRGTRLDDCQTCHKGGTFTSEDKGKTSTATKNACDYCHLILHPDSTFKEPQPKKYSETLNAYGADYMTAGRSRQALRDLDSADSDGDGFANGVEIADLKYPGDPQSKPGQPNAPQRVFTLDELKALAHHSQFQLSNSTKQQYDDYASYTGVKLRDLIAAAGVDPDDTAITGVTLIAPDGFMKDFKIADVNRQYPAGLFYGGLDTAGLGTTCGFVKYPNTLPAGVADGQPIPGEQWLTLAWERDGSPMDVCTLDVTAGKINGEGPYRIAVPQKTPGKPDRGSQYSPTTCNDGLDFDAQKDHNAGDMVRGVVAVRINPLPAGYEDFDAKNGGWAFIANSSLIVYGYGVH